MFFNSVKEIHRLRKEINRLLSKKMSNIYLKVTIEKSLDFLNLENLSPSQFLGSSNSQISLNFKTFCCNLKIRGLGAKPCMSMHYVEQKHEP